MQNVKESRKSGIPRLKHAALPPCSGPTPRIRARDEVDQACRRNGHPGQLRFDVTRSTGAAPRDRLPFAPVSRGIRDEQSRMNRARCTVVLLLVLNSCGKKDPFDDPGYAAGCHGPPLRTVEARNQAMEDGYAINPRYDCIDKKTWEAEEQAKAVVADMVSKAEREARDAAARPTQSLADARAGFRTAVGVPAAGTPLPKPPPALFVRSDYTGAEGRTLAAFVTPDPRDGQRHAAIVWITGGDSSTLEDFWSEGSPDNDQSASAFRKAGVIMMFPTLRGGNVDEGRHEFFFGEVDDIHAASNHLANLPYVDPARIYLGGHSTGGTL